MVHEEILEAAPSPATIGTGSATNLGQPGNHLLGHFSGVGFFDAL